MRKPESEKDQPRDRQSDRASDTKPETSELGVLRRPPASERDAHASISLETNLELERSSSSECSIKPNHCHRSSDQAPEDSTRLRSSPSRRDKMYCVFNATTTHDADTGNPLGWPLEDNYGYFCDQRDKGEMTESKLSLSSQDEHPSELGS